MRKTFKEFLSEKVNSKKLAKAKMKSVRKRMQKIYVKNKDVFEYLAK